MLRPCEVLMALATPNQPQYLQLSSCNPVAHKRATLLKRPDSHCSTHILVHEEKAHKKETLQQNEYSDLPH